MPALRPRYTDNDLRPIQTGPFTLSRRRRDLEMARYGNDRVPMPAHFDVRTLVNQQAVAAIRKAFTQAKTSHRAWKSNQRVGRFDVRQAPRIQNGAQDVFKHKTGRSTTHVKVSVLIDGSGSMRTLTPIQRPGSVKPDDTVMVERHVAAALFGATIATALGNVPTIDLDIFQHAAGGNTMTLKYRWHRGTPVAVFNGQAGHGHLGQGGNADGHALHAITTRMQREIRRDTKGIILVVSDGLPSDYSPTGTADGGPKVRRYDGNEETDAQHAQRTQGLKAGQALVDACAEARRLGYEVIAVAIDGSDQSTYYGKDNMIQFTGDWTALGKALGQHIGAALAAR